LTAFHSKLTDYHLIFTITPLYIIKVFLILLLVFCSLLTRFELAVLLVYQNQASSEKLCIS